MSETTRICIVGLGYVGLPLAVGLAGHFPVIGFDVSSRRIAELRRGLDRNREISPERLAMSRLEFTADIETARACDIFIITVPTPVDAENKPDLTAVKAACRSVGVVLGKGSVVVLESTVYPGVTEEICGPEIASVSRLMCGIDFHLGYSPERINPGDKQHTVDRITKVVSGQTPEVAARLAKIYGAINGGNIFVASSIRAAEAAKVIENAQRDINIAFINEVTMIFNRYGLSIYDVLDAARTKWNFLPFTPGLVGGHCIGVDPFYLADFAQRRDHHPAVILAGRRINDSMGAYVADSLMPEICKSSPSQGARILVLGLTFKENVPDLRNSKVIDIARGLMRHNCQVDIYDPFADSQEARHEYDVDLLPSLKTAAGYHCVIGAVPHDEFRSLTAAQLASWLAPNGLIADVKGMWRHLELPAGCRRWQL